MPDTIVPDDLAGHARGVRALTGLQGGDVGVAPDERHKSGGGYHCGCADIVALDKYPDGDYSTRQPRDRVGGNVACAVDVGDDWPNGGRAAWLRYNRELVRRLQAGDPRLSALRAVNYTDDGSRRLRYDTLHPDAGVNGDGVIPSTDTVTIHTHEEFWRNTEGTAGRRATLALLLRIMEWAISGAPIPPVPTGDDDMPYANIPVPPKGGRASISLPGGGANRASTWIAATNDTGDIDGVAHPYGLRIFLSNGSTWYPAGGGTGLFKGYNGVTLSVAAPGLDVQGWGDGVRAVSVMEAPLSPGGTVLDPIAVLRQELHPADPPAQPYPAIWYAGLAPLTFCIEQA